MDLHDSFVNAFGNGDDLSVLMHEQEDRIRVAAAMRTCLVPRLGDELATEIAMTAAGAINTALLTRALRVVRGES